MIAFTVRGRLFRTRWVWFATPADTAGYDEVAFLSYEQATQTDFREKSGNTQCIDLTQPEDKLWGGLREKFVRKQINRGEKSGIRVRTGTLSEFMPVYRSLRSAKGFTAGALRDVAPIATILVAESASEILAGGVFIHDGTFVRAYALASRRFGKTEGRYREVVGYASRMIIWEAMKLFKAYGCHTFDMGGIASNTDNSEDRSLYEFKTAFGGYQQRYFFYRKAYNPVLRALQHIRRTRSV